MALAIVFAPNAAQSRSASHIPAQQRNAQRLRACKWLSEHAAGEAASEPPPACATNVLPACPHLEVRQVQAHSRQHLVRLQARQVCVKCLEPFKQRRLACFVQSYEEDVQLLFAQQGLKTPREEAEHGWSALARSSASLRQGWIACSTIHASAAIGAQGTTLHRTAILALKSPGVDSRTDASAAAPIHVTSGCQPTEVGILLTTPCSRRPSSFLSMITSNGCFKRAACRLATLSL